MAVTCKQQFVVPAVCFLLSDLFQSMLHWTRNMQLEFKAVELKQCVSLKPWLTHSKPAFLPSV